MTALLIFCAICAYHAFRCPDLIAKGRVADAVRSGMLFILFAFLVAAQWVVMEGRA